MMKPRWLWLCVLIISLLPTGVQAQGEVFEARRRIQAVIAQQSLELDLSGLGLTELPPDIGALSQLQVLNLSNNRLLALPPEIGNLANLQILNLSANPLTTLPPEIGRLGALQTLNLSHTAIDQFPPPVLQLGNLYWLNIGHTTVSQLPPEITSLTLLRWLDVPHTPISQLPLELGRLTDLAWLDVSYTAVSELPTTLAALTGLRMLITDGTPWAEQNQAIAGGTASQIQAYLRPPGDPIIQQPRDPVTIKWYVGLGTGTGWEQLEVEERLVEAFNNSQDEIILELVCVCGSQTAYETLNTLALSGETLDIIGPIGFDGANRFTQTDWLDLQPLVESHGYDLTQFPSNMVETYRTPDGGLSALPFAVFPGVLYYNADLFDAAGLHYPPTIPGEPYIMPDGSQLPWDYETVALIGSLLTLDSAGHNATHPSFDPASTVQFGFAHQWDSLRSDFHTFGSAHVVNENGQAVIPENWRAQAHWFWDGVWGTHFIPSNVQLMSDELNNNNVFASGRVAMARSMAWYTCCLGEEVTRWDIALQPAYDGTIYAPADFDSFYIHESTLYPDESFVVLQYLLGAAAPDLLTIYDAFPARPDLQEMKLNQYQERYPTVQNWEVFSTSTQFVPAVHQDTPYPNYEAGQDRFSTFLAMLRGEDGANIDLDAELDSLQADLQLIVDYENGQDACERPFANTPDTVSEVRRRIQRAIDQQATTLDLSGLNLTELPAELWQATQLESLDLSRHLLCSLPSDISLLTNLKTLNLSNGNYNSFLELPDEIGQLSNLETLDLSSPSLRRLPASIGRLSKLRVLKLHATYLPKLPPEIGQLVNLEVLDLSYTKILRLPPEIGLLINLHTLEINGTYLKVPIPPEIGRLSNLRVLDFSDSTYFLKLPPEIGYLTDLQMLNIDISNFTTLASPDGSLKPEQVPSEIGYLTDLQSLGIDTTRWGQDIDNTNIASVQAYLRSLRIPLRN